MYKESVLGVFVDFLIFDGVIYFSRLYFVVSS